jgi:hypothetical protein
VRHIPGWRAQISRKTIIIGAVVVAVVGAAAGAWQTSHSKGPVSIVACIRTAVTRNGVALNCGGRGVLIPATVSVTSPRPA